MDESRLVGALNTDISPSSKTFVGMMTTEELVAKAIAPVKKEFLRPHSVRTSIVTSEAVSDDVSEKKSAPVNSLIKEKKSKRQFKRDRLQEQKSALHICPKVAKTGNVDSCIYKDSCRFSHDIEAFKEQKPADLEGDCPFLNTEGPCPYGLACRYLGTHESDVSNGSLTGVQKGSEVNGLSKDVQKLLWKNKMEFPKADAKLKALGLLEKAYSKKKKVDEEKVVSNVSLVNDENDHKVASDTANNNNDNISTEGHSLNVPETEASPAVTLVTDEQGPLKKSKPVIDENCSNGGEVGMAVDEIVTDDSAMETDASLKLHPREKKLIDFRDKLYLAPLTTVGNLPFRRVCKMLGADVTCGEMAMCTNLLQGQASEWALLRRHSSEDLFGVQICGAFPDNVARVVELIDQECSVDFIDINMGCPIDLVVNKGAGSALLLKPLRMKNIIESASEIVEKPITVKVRTGYLEGRNRVDLLIEDIGRWGASALTIHGRSRQQRYTKLADWDYINQCVKKAPEALQVIGNGDVFSYVDWNKHKSDSPGLSTCMIARGALVKPWIFTEIKEQRHWDISSGERLDILRDYVRCGLQHWGSDSKGVETTRHFLLEWLNYTYRYVPVALLDVIPPQLNWRPPSYVGRDDLETLMASESAADWVRISEMLLGKVPDSFKFAPKHKSNAYDKAENG